MPIFSFKTQKPDLKKKQIRLKNNILTNIFRLLWERYCLPAVSGRYRPGIAAKKNRHYSKKSQQS
jgi:hypothetical protein